MTRPDVGVVVLAAGSSSRLGRPKQLLCVSGRPLLERTLDVVGPTTLAPRILVLGAAADEIEVAVDTDTFDIVRNPDHRSGQASSLRTGLSAVGDDLDGVIVLLGDQPLVQPWLLNALVDHFDSGIHVAVRPAYADGTGNPVLLARAIFPELMRLEGDVGARDLLRRYQDRVLDIDWTRFRSPRDVDTEEDYAALLLDWAASGAPDPPRYCQRCGTEIGVQVRHNRLRPVCPRCGFTYFHDPKIAAVVVVEIDGQVVLQRRKIDPARGKWTFPGGFVDRGEPLPVAAAREVHEEVGLTVENPRLIGMYSEPGETVVLAAFRASANGQQPICGDESDDVRLFPPDALPEFAFHRDARVIADWLAIR